MPGPFGVADPLGVERLRYYVVCADGVVVRAVKIVRPFVDIFAKRFNLFCPGAVLLGPEVVGRCLGQIARRHRCFLTQRFDLFLFRVVFELIAVDLVLLVMNAKGLEGLLSSRATLGADISIAAGAVGRRTETGTDMSLKAELQSYSRARGLFAGISIEGAAIVQDAEANSAFYGVELSARDILTDTQVIPPFAAKSLAQRLAAYSNGI